MANNHLFKNESLAKIYGPGIDRAIAVYIAMPVSEKLLTPADIEPLQLRVRYDLVRQILPQKIRFHSYQSPGIAAVIEKVLTTIELEAFLEYQQIHLSMKPHCR